MLQDFPLSEIGLIINLPSESTKVAVRIVVSRWHHKCFQLLAQESPALVVVP